MNESSEIIQEEHRILEASIWRLEPRLVCVLFDLICFGACFLCLYSLIVQEERRGGPIPGVRIMAEPGRFMM